MSDEQPIQKKSEDRHIDHGADQKIKGVFSTQTIQTVGTGTTTRKTVKKTFWMVEELEECIEIQPLNVNYVPSGPKRMIPKEDFLEKFSPEPEFYVSTVFPKMNELKESIKKGDKHRTKGETFSAEVEYEHAVNLDEDNVRANFGLGLTYLERGDDTKANDIFERLVKLDAAFELEHKHLFNEFGINLRKNKMYEQSVDYYERAIELASSDENLHYNIARAYYEREQFGECAKHLKMAMNMNNDFAEAAQFMKFLQDNNLVDDEGNTKNGVTKPADKKKPKKNDNTNYSMDL
ncbi:MAG: tetratricopeptide repeat protein [Proteobacteria bacterium]|nr:tetratricopeptide repeat protein [Pseudomonadota bacterium]